MEFKQLQSFSEYEYFKTVVVAHSKELAEKIAFWFTGAECVWRGNFYKNKTDKFLAYCRWFNNPSQLPTTVYADAMLIYLENAEQFNDLSGYINSHRGIVNKLIISDSENFSEIAQTFRGRWMQKPEAANLLKQELLDFDSQFVTNAKTIFEKFDINQNGYIEVEELEKLSNELGEGFSVEDIEKVKNLIISSKKGISFDNFIIWWKLGKQNSFALKTLITLENFASSAASEGVKILDEIKDKLLCVNNDEENLSNHKFKVFSGNVEENPGFQFLFEFFLGAERKEACINYLKQWTTNFNSASGVFLDFDFLFDESVEGSEIKRILDEKVEMLLGFLDALPDVKNLITTFCIIETYGNKNSGKLTFRLKVDAEGLLKKHTKNIFYVFDHVLNELSQHFQFCLKTKISPKEAFSNNLNGFQSLKDFEAELKIMLMREHLRLFAKKIPRELRELLYIISAPSNLDLNVRINLERAAGPKLTPILETPLGFIHQMIQMIPLEMIFGDESTTIRKIKEIQVAINLFFLFSRIKLHVEGILDE